MAAFEYRKTCDCKGASASGPRFVMVEAPKDWHPVYRLKMEYAFRACDTCDKPWDAVGPVITRPVEAL